MNKILSAIVLTAVCASTAWAQPRPAVVQVAIAEQQRLTPETWVPGSVVSRADARVAAEVEGILLLVAEVGDRVREGDTLNEALERGLKELDGFYTFAIGVRDGFAVLRDPIACKPAVIAENDDWVAMSSEFRAIAQLPGAREANIWEPEPATIYSWSRN